MTRSANRWRVLALVAVAELLAMTTWFSTAAVVPQLRADWGLSEPATSWLTIGVQLGFVVGAVTSAATGLADRVAPRLLMLLGASGAAVANLLLLSVQTVEAALVLRMATGAALAGVYPPALKLLATWFTRGRGVALGVLIAALTLGSATPHLVNAFGGLHWQTVIVVTSLLTAAGGALAYVTGHEGPASFGVSGVRLGHLSRAFANRGVRLATIGYLGHMWELYAMWAWFGVFLADVVARTAPGAAPSFPGYATFVVIGAGAAGSVAGGVLADRWGRARLAGTAMTLSGACALTIGFLADAPVWLVVCVGIFWGFWVIADSAQFSAIVTESADPGLVGTALTMQLGAGFVLTVATIYLVPLLRLWEGWGPAFAVLALGPAVGVAAMLRLAGLRGEARTP